MLRRWRVVRGTLVLAVLAAACAAVSCISTAARLPVPEATPDGRVGVTWQRTNSLEEVVVEDAAVERLLAFLRAHNDGWHTPWDTFPTPQYTISLKRDQELLLVVYVGANWIGGREGGGSSNNRLRSLSGPERAEVLEILGVQGE